MLLTISKTKGIRGITRVGSVDPHLNTGMELQI